MAKKKAPPPKSAPATRRSAKKLEIVAMDADTGVLLPTNQRQSLVAWFNLYMGLEVGQPLSNTFKAKAADLTRFMEYFSKQTGGDQPDQWTPSVSKGFVSYLRKTKSAHSGQTLAPSTINRILATLRVAARWIHRQRPFLAGYPLEKVTDISTEEPTWKGLTDVQVTRLKSAAEQLLKINKRANQTAIRDQAILLVLLGTALRVSELANLDIEKYHDEHLHRVQRKGNNITERVFVPQEARDALENYLAGRGMEAGPLFRSKTGKRMAIQNIAEALNRIAKQANAKAPAKEAFSVSPHDLRHTALRRMAEKKGIQFAQKMAGHASSHYIWRYVQPSADQMEEAVEGLFD